MDLLFWITEKFNEILSTVRFKSQLVLLVDLLNEVENKENKEEDDLSQLSEEELLKKTNNELKEYFFISYTNNTFFMWF